MGTPGEGTDGAQPPRPEGTSRVGKQVAPRAAAKQERGRRCEGCRAARRPRAPAGSLPGLREGRLRQALGEFKGQGEGACVPGNGGRWAQVYCQGTG